MRWHDVLRAIGEETANDQVMIGLYGQDVRLAGEVEHKVPLLEMTLVGDAEGELWAPCTVQFDQWAFTLDDIIASELRLRQLFHTELPVEIQGVFMWCEYQDGSELSVPSRDGYYGRAFRVQFSPIRGIYAHAEEV